MRPRIRTISALLLLFATLSTTVRAQDELRASLFAEANAALEAARAASAELLAPTDFSRALDSYSDAAEDYERGRNVDRIRVALAEVVDLLEQAIERAEIAEITLAALIKTRDDALNANAEIFVPGMWAEAEEAFDETARRLEYGNIRQTRELSAEAEALFRDAELESIKRQYLSSTEALLAEAEQLDADEYAPRTLRRARELLEQAEQALNENRYDTDLPRSLAQQANYEADHAKYLATLIERVDEDEMTIEDLVLMYEEPLTRIAAAADRVAALHEGTDVLTEELILYIDELREQAAQSETDLNDSRARIVELEDEIRELDEQLGGVSQERVALVQRLEAEARIREQFESIETMFGREEARVSREGNNLNLRLVGLTFESGSSEITQEHHELLQKVADAASVFLNSQIIIEGHTDSYGRDDTNLSLSQERAEAVSTYLAELGIPAFRMSSEGYGETRPIANNETEQGRTRNRRIEVRIEPQL